jgi:CheY-like chemotaxis protein
MILLDINMPVMNGLEAARAVRASERGGNIPIVGISGDGGAEENDACYEAGMNLIVSKLELNENKFAEIADFFWGATGTLVDAQPISEDPDNKPEVASPDRLARHDVIDYQKALQGFDNDEALLAKLLVEFTGIVRSQLVIMRQALEQSDFDRIRKESHGIKGGAANIFAAPLTDAAKRLETACKGHPKREFVSGVLDSFANVFTAFDTFVKTAIEKRD